MLIEGLEKVLGNVDRLGLGGVFLADSRGRDGGCVDADMNRMLVLSLDPVVDIFAIGKVKTLRLL